MLDTIFPKLSALAVITYPLIRLHGFKTYPYPQPHGRSLEIIKVLGDRLVTADDKARTLYR